MGRHTHCCHCKERGKHSQHMTDTPVFLWCFTNLHVLLSSLDEAKVECLSSLFEWVKPKTMTSFLWIQRNLVTLPTFH
jgi:hypothetical protein